MERFTIVVDVNDGDRGWGFSRARGDEIAPHRRVARRRGSFAVWLFTLGAWACRA